MVLKLFETRPLFLSKENSRSLFFIKTKISLFFVQAELAPPPLTTQTKSKTQAFSRYSQVKTVKKAFTFHQRPKFSISSKIESVD